MKKKTDACLKLPIPINPRDTSDLGILGHTHYILDYPSYSRQNMPCLGHFFPLLPAPTLFPPSSIVSRQNMFCPNL
jgi:hypothetical protein